MGIKPPVDEVLPLECFACRMVFKHPNQISGIRELTRDTSAYNFTWVDGHIHERNFEDIIFDGTSIYALCKRCDFFK